MNQTNKLRVSALFASGKTPHEIAKATKLKEEEITDFLIERGKLPSENSDVQPADTAEVEQESVKEWKDMTEDERKVAIDEYNNGMGTYELASKYRTDRIKLAAWLKDHGVVMRGRGPAPKSINKKKAETKAKKAPKVEEKAVNAGENAANTEENAVNTGEEALPAKAPTVTVEEDLAAIKSIPVDIPTVESFGHETLIRETYNVMKRAAEALRDAFSTVEEPRKSSIYMGEAYGRLHEQIFTIERTMHWEEDSDEDNSDNK